MPPCAACAGPSAGVHHAARIALLGPRSLLVPARTSDGRIESVRCKGLLQGLRFHDLCVQFGAMVERVDAARKTLGIGVDEQAHAGFGRASIAEDQCLPEFPCFVDVEQRYRRRRWREGLQQQVQQDRGILADGIQQDRIAEAGHGLAQDVDALRFEFVQ